MKFFNFLFVVSILTLTIACEKKNQEIDIRGDWYTIHFLSHPLDSLVDHEIDFEYREDYITDSIVFTYFSSMGYVSPSKFHISKDSVFSAFGIENTDYQYKGKIKMISNNQFVLYDDSFIVNYYRLTDATEVLSKYIINLDSENPRFTDSTNAFSKAFHKRSNELYLKIKDTLLTINF